MIAREEGDLVRPKQSLNHSHTALLFCSAEEGTAVIERTCVVSPQGTVLT